MNHWFYESRTIIWEQDKHFAFIREFAPKFELKFYWRERTGSERIWEFVFLNLKFDFPSRLF